MFSQWFLFYVPSRTFTSGNPSGAPSTLADFGSSTIDGRTFFFLGGEMRLVVFFKKNVVDFQTKSKDFEWCPLLWYLAAWRFWLQALTPSGIAALGEMILLLLPDFFWRVCSMNNMARVCFSCFEWKASQWRPKDYVLCCEVRHGKGTEESGASFRLWVWTGWVFAI